MERRMVALQKAHKELEDSFIVLTHVETRMSNLLRDQSSYMANHEARLIKSEARLQRIETNLAEATDKINLLVDREVRREGGPEAKR
jgi:septal ring factor EnvC (AmiA/AmiB activator)